MSTTNNPNPPLSLDSQIDEDRVRRALGLTPGAAPHQQRPEQARQRHRFVADGAVPVVMLNRADSDVGALRDKLAAAESALDAERAAHAATRRTLADVQAAHQLLQTRFGHAELAHHEALTTEREARRAAEETAASLRAELAERPAFKPEPATPVTPAARKQDAAPRIRKVRVAVAKEPKPVRWWTPSYRSKTNSK